MNLLDRFFFFFFFYPSARKSSRKTTVKQAETSSGDRTKASVRDEGRRRPPGRRDNSNISCSSVWPTTTRGTTSRQERKSQYDQGASFASKTRRLGLKFYVQSLDVGLFAVSRKMCNVDLIDSFARLHLMNRNESLKSLDL